MDGAALRATIRDTLVSLIPVLGTLHARHVYSQVAAERAKLSADDRDLVDAQEWCVVNNEGRLGSMGQPVKLIIKGQPVFLCCSGCRKKAEADPDKTLAKLDELKRKKASKSQKG